MRCCINCNIIKEDQLFRKNRSKCKECEYNLYSIKPKSRYKKYLSSALRRGLRFDLTYKEFISFENKDCYYCGTIIDGVRLDRVDNNSGYTIKNIVPCCKQCNFLKGSFDLKEFFDIINKIKIKQGL